MDSESIENGPKREYESDHDTYNGISILSDYVEDFYDDPRKKRELFENGNDLCSEAEKGTSCAGVIGYGKPSGRSCQ